MAGLHFPITADHGSFMRILNEVTAGVRDASRQIEAEGGSIDRVISTIKGGLATLGVGLGLKELSAQIFNTRSQFEQLEIAFTTMLGSAEKADALLTQLKQTAAKTPFEMEDVVGGAKSLLAYGIEAEKVNDTLIRLGDIASGLGIRLNDLTYLYGTTMVQGRMFTQDLRQFQGRGVPIADELAKILGIAEDKVGEAVTAGEVGAKELEQAIVGLTSEGGKFGGLMAKQSDSLKGKWENIKDTIGLMFNEMGQQTSGVMNLTLDATASIVDHWQEVITVLGGVAAAYGAQKAFLALDSGFTRAATNYGYDAEITQLQALIPVKEEAAKTDLEQAVASGNLTKAKAEQVAALREEAHAQLEALAAKEAAAQAEAVSTAEKLNSINEEIRGINDLKQSLLEQYTEATNAGDAEKAQAIASEIATAETWLKEEASTAETIAEEARTAATNAAAASEARESLATQINTANTAGNTAATSILTIAKEKLAVAIAKVNMMLKANQFSLVTGAVIALGYAVYKLVTYQTDYEKSLDRLEKAHANNQKEIFKESVEIERLFGKLKHAKKGTEEWEKARSQIWSKYGNYLKSLGDEKTALNDVAAAYELVKEKAIEAAKARAMDSFLQSEGDTYATDMANYFEKAYQLVSKKFGEKFAAANEDSIRNIIEGKANVDKDFLEKFNSYTTYTSTYGTSQTVTNNELAALLGAAANRRKDFDKLYAEAERKFGISQKEASGIVGKEKPQEITPVRDGSKIDEDIKEKKSKLSQYKKDSTEYKNLLKEITALEKERALWGAESDLKSLKNSDQLEAKGESAAGKLADTLRKQQQERLRIEQDYEFERWQSRIDLMEEGEDKVLAQQKLNFEKEKTDLQRRLESELEAERQRQKEVFDAREDEKAAGDKTYAKKTFSDSDIDESAIKAIEKRYKALQADLSKSQKKAEDDRLQSAKESFEAYLKEFGNYQQKREAIEEEYTRKIAEASNSGERMMLEAQKGKALSDLDYQQWIDSGDVALAFGDISNLSKETITRLISDMEKYREKVIATFDPEKIEKYEDALRDLREAEVEDTFTAFGNMVPEYFTKRLAIQKQINDEAQIGLELIRKQDELSMRTTAQKDIVKIEAKNAGYNISDEDLADPNKVQQIADKLKASAASGNSFTSALHAALLELLKLNGVAVDLDDAVKEWDGNFAHLKETLNNLDGDEKFKAICESVSEAAGLVGNLAGKASEMADALGAEGLGDALGYLEDAMGSVQDIASGFAQGGLIGGIAACAGAVMDWVTKIAMAGDAKHQKNIERIQDRIDALQKSYDKLGKAADKAYSTDASAMIEQQNTLLRQQQVLIKKQMAEEKAKKNSDKEKLEEYQDQLDEINEQLEENKEKAKEAIIGTDLKSAIDDFASAYAEAWEENTDSARKSMQTVKSIVSSALNEMLKKNIQPFAESFYNYLADAMSDGVLTNYELDRLDELKTNIDIAASKYEGMVKTINERYDDDYSSQSGAESSFSGITQETGNSIDGRLTAVYMKQSEMHTLDAERNSLAIQILASVREFTSLSSCLNDSNSALRDIRDMMFISTNHLEDIARQAKNLALINAGIENLHHLINQKL